MKDYSELKRLAEMAPGTVWRHHIHHHPKSNTYSHTIQTDEDFGEPVAYTETSPRSEHECAAAAFIAAANPAAILALITENESMAEFKEHMVQLREAHGFDSWSSALVEIDKLKAENEVLRKDAGRYRWLREKPIPLEGHDFLSSHEILDYRIDAAMSKEV